MNSSITHADWEDYLETWEELREDPDISRWYVDEKRQVWVGEDAGFVRKYDVRPPLPFANLSTDMALDSYLSDGDFDELPSYGMFLMQAGAVALGYFEDGEVVLHKAFKKYMVRAKRGKAQLTYLNTRGKSKAGSRIRLANTEKFIQEINQYLDQWEAYDAPARWLYSCPATLWGLLFAADPPPPFPKSDPRLSKLPFDVHIPDFGELQRINRMALRIEIRKYMP